MNVLIIAIDTLRADHLGCYGYEHPTSPSIDRLAARGVRFERAVSTAPWTLPSFGSLFTGLYPSRHGAGMYGRVRQLSQASPPLNLAREVPTLAEQFAAAGYRTQAFVSNPYLGFGLDRGFAEFQMVARDSVGSRVRQWVEEDANGEAPFFLFAHFNEPHEPTNPPDEWLEAVGREDVLHRPGLRRFHRWGGGRGDPSHLGRQLSRDAAREYVDTKLALYDAMIWGVDAQVGALLEQLEESGLAENTLIVLLSDHGEEFLDHMEAGRTLGGDPRGIWGIGHGHTLFDELLHVPLIIAGPGLGAGETIAEQFTLLDVMPTLLEMLDLPPVEGIDGSGRQRWIRDEDRKPVACAAEDLAYGPDLIGYSDGIHKLIALREGPNLWHFDLGEDPLETRNLSEDEPAEALRAELDQWSARMMEDPPEHEAADLDAATLQRLRALGYID